MSYVPVYTDFEIRIFARQGSGYPIEVTVDRHIFYGRGYLDAGFLPFEAGKDADRDGRALFEWLLADERFRAAWNESRAQQPRRRVRLIIDRDAPEIHNLPWELLIEERDDHPALHVAAATATPFSRYLAGAWQPGRPILTRPIKVLAAIASPADLESMGMPPFNVEQEWQNLKRPLADIAVEVTYLPQPCTLGAIEAALRKGYHVLHIVAHGYFDLDLRQALLLLCNGEGNTDLVSEQKFAEMLARLMATATDDEGHLRLVYLDGCETAMRDSADAFRGFGPALVRAGVPAVIAMQEAVNVRTSRQFTTTFYGSLLEHGLVDLAANQARATILTENLPGAAIPVLFMRLQGGQLLGKRGQILGDQPESFWSALLDNIADEYCVPFLGPGVTAHLLPTPGDLAQSLAAKYNYPFATSRNLPRVSQFVDTMDRQILRRSLVQYLIEGFHRKLGLDAPQVSRRARLSEFIATSDWIDRSRQLFETEIHQQLASLNLPLYVTTNFDTFMLEALRSNGKDGREEEIHWREPLRRQASRPQTYLQPEPTAVAPVVLHLFGTADDLLSMVITEDDHLDYLTLIARDHEYLLPSNVRKMLSESTLLFLGYRLQDLDLKVIMRGLLTNIDLTRWGKLHVAVQLDDESVDELKVQEVTRFFQKYFAESRIDVYWGSTQQFVNELYQRWQEHRYG
ncbi:MAG: CHAT domain-containing protein [Caldilineaceae bacterium]|nr:CHAT domain-containing protein [Caldilineaceae bacterium]